MKLSTIVILLSLGFSSVSHAQQQAKDTLTLKSGKVLKEAEFITEDPTRGVKVKHAEGIAWIKPFDLPTDFLSKHSIKVPEALAKGQIKADAERDKINRFKALNPTFRDRDGMVHQSSEIVAVEPTSLKLERGGMVQRIDFEKLPQNVVQFFEYDAAKVAAEKERMATLADKYREREEARQGAASILDGNKASANLDLVQKIEDGYICTGNIFTVKTRDVEVNRRFNGLANKEIFDIKRIEVEEIEAILPTTIVIGLPPSFLDARKWKGALWFGGWRQYTSVGGEVVTARLAFTDRELGMKYIVENGFHVEGAPESRRQNPNNRAASGRQSPESPSSATGTGFAVAANGYIATAFHVVNEAKSIKVVIDGKELDAVVVAKDQNNDLAVIKVDHSNLLTLPIAKSTDQKVGDDVFTTGFPDPQIQGENVKLTKGSINAASGIRDNTAMFQVSVGVHGGNSGGPLVNRKGEVVGVIVSKLGLKYFLTTNEMPQNVNYAVKADFLLLLLNTIPGFVGSQGAASIQQSSPEEAAQKATFLIRVRSS